MSRTSHNVWRFLCWVPVVGMVAELIYSLLCLKNYLSDQTHGFRFTLSIVWHVSTILALAALLSYFDSQ